MPAVGIDISDYSIKFMCMRAHAHEITLDAYGKFDIPLGTIERGEVKDMQTLSSLLARLHHEHNFTFAHLALPEEHAYLFETKLPMTSEQEMTQMIEFNLKENVPLGAEEALFDYSIVHTTGTECVVNVSVYPITYVTSYLDACEAAHLTPLSIEIEGQATARALIPWDSPDTVLIVDIGRTSASLSISCGSIVTFTANLEVGGDTFTRAMARALDVSFQEADKMKRTHGFIDSPESATVYGALRPSIEQFKETIRHHLMYWQMHASTSEGRQADVSRMVLVGGNANMSGLAEYLEAELDVPVDVGNVWTNVFNTSNVVPPIHRNESLEYATATGLALRSLYRS